MLSGVVVYSFRRALKERLCLTANKKYIKNIQKIYTNGSFVSSALSNVDNCCGLLGSVVLSILLMNNIDSVQQIVGFKDRQFLADH